MPQDVDSPRGIVRGAGDENAFRLGARILDISPVPIAYLSAGLVVLQCNRAAAAHLAAGGGDPLSRRLEDLVGRDSPIHAAAATAARMLKPVTAHLPSAPGGDRLVVTLSPDLDSRGAPLGLVLTIAEELAPRADEAPAGTQAETAAPAAPEREAPQEADRLRTELGRNLTLLRAVVDRSMEGVMIVDTQGHIRLYNPAMQEISGYSAEEAAERGWFDLVHPEPRERERSVARVRRAAAGQPIEGETSIVHKDGGRRWVRHSLCPIAGYDEPLVLALVADATERHEAEREMRESEELFRAIFELSSAGMAQVDMQGRFKRVNRRFAELLGHPRERMEELSFQDFTHPDDIEPDMRNIQRILDGETDTFTMEKRYIRADGEPVWTLLTVASARDEEGRPQYMVGVVQDISARKREEDLALALHRIDSTIHSSLRFEEIMGGVVVDAVEALGSDYGRILLCEEGKWTTRFACRLPEQESGATSFTDEEAPGFGLAARERSVLAVDDAAGDPRTQGEHVQREGIRSTLIVPLISRGKVRGIFELAYCSRSMRFSPVDASFAERVASSTALALENARLYQTQQDVADTLQEAIIHMPSKVPGIAFCWLYGSATEASRVGGDFLDLFPLSDNRVGTLIGDVSGKGIEAAALTAVVKNVVRAFAYEDPSPASVMHRLNRVVQLETGPEMFVTVLFGVLDTTTGWMRYCSGGHPPAILLRARDGVESLNTVSPIVGALPAARFEEGFERLEEGDTLLMYTDGAIEARNEHGELFGADRLVEAFTNSLDDGGLREVCESVFDTVSEWSSGNLTDDIALLPLRLDPKGTAPPCCGENPPPRFFRR